MFTNRDDAYDETEASLYDRATLAALFDTATEARLAVADLHDAGFHGTWLGVAQAPEDAAELPTGTRPEHVVAGEGIGASLLRLFGAGDETLYDALTKRGIPSQDAIALDRRMRAGGAVVTVVTEERYDAARAILERGTNAVASSRDAAAIPSRAVAPESAGYPAPGLPPDAAATIRASGARVPADADPRAISREDFFHLRLPAAAYDGDRGDAESGAPVPGSAAGFAARPGPRPEVVVDRRARRLEDAPAASDPGAAI